VRDGIAARRLGQFTKSSEPEKIAQNRWLKLFFLLFTQTVAGGGNIHFRIAQPLERAPKLKEKPIY
jgi:hypothetical protein